MTAPARPLRLLGLVTEAYGGSGGIAQYNRDFWDTLAGLPEIAALDLLPRHAASDGAAPTRLRVHPARGGRAAFALVALRLTLRLRPDVIVCGHLFMAPLAALAAHLAGARLVVQLHGIEIWREPGALRRRALERADLVLCVSRDTRARLLALADIAPERAVVLPNTVADDYEPRAGARPGAHFDEVASGSSSKCASEQNPGAGHGSSAEPRVLLSVGRLDAREAYKGQDAVIACLPQLRRLGHDVLYRIAGEGDDRPRLERLAREIGVAERVAFLGAVARDALPDLYRAADLFVLPSRGEGFGIVFLEAMACGTPALGLAAGGAVDALDGLGLAVPPEDLAAAIAAELDRTAAGRSENEVRALAARVRARFGRGCFERGLAQALSRLGLAPCAEPCPAARPSSDRLGVPA